MAPDVDVGELDSLRPDWSDVLRRAERHRQHRKRRRLVTIAVTLAVAAIAVPALATTGMLRSLVPGTSVSPSRLSATDIRGLAVLATRKPIGLDQLELSSRRRTALGAFGLQDLRLIAVRSGVSFYVLGRRNGRRCYAVGPDRPGNLFGEVSCGGPADVFPAPQQPVFDLSIDGANAPNEPMHAIQLRGIAADGIAVVGVLGSDGHIHGKTEVRDNVFVSDALPPSADGPLVAYDPRGEIVWCGEPTAVCPPGLGQS